MSELIVGIDLGTTNSEIAAFVDGKPQIIGNGSQLMLPSCVGISPSGDLLIGQAARNQMLLYPERTVRSVKRLMGSNERVHAGRSDVQPAGDLGPDPSRTGPLGDRAALANRFEKRSSRCRRTSPMPSATPPARPGSWRDWKWCES